MGIRVEERQLIVPHIFINKKKSLEHPHHLVTKLEAETIEEQAEGKRGEGGRRNNESQLSIDSFVTCLPRFEFPTLLLSLADHSFVHPCPFVHPPRENNSNKL